MGGSNASPQADAICRRELCLRKTSSAMWRITQHRDLVGIPSALLTQVSGWSGIILDPAELG